MARAAPSPAEDLFWDCAAQLFEETGVAESTMFGFRCLRIDGQFVAMAADDSLWVKLPEQRVSDIIEAGQGEVCAPAGKPFREWVSVHELSEPFWLELLRESIGFVRPR